MEIVEGTNQEWYLQVVSSKDLNRGIGSFLGSSLGSYRFSVDLIDILLGSQACPQSTTVT